MTVQQQTHRSMVTFLRRYRLNRLAEKIGYTKEELSSIPAGAFIGLFGCGNPVAFAGLNKDELVIDLGCGTGVDVFLAAQRVGNRGRVIGIDIAGAVIEKTRANAKQDQYSNVRLCQGDIRSLPIRDNAVDVLISNFVINSVKNNQRIFKETLRILKKGGRLIISDAVALERLPEKIIRLAKFYGEDISGMLKKDDYLDEISNSGFQNIKILKQDNIFMYHLGIDALLTKIVRRASWQDIRHLDRIVVGIIVSATK